jgi:hypothetical protein
MRPTAIGKGTKAETEGAERLRVVQRQKGRAWIYAVDLRPDRRVVDAGAAAASAFFGAGALAAAAFDAGAFLDAGALVAGAFFLEAGSLAGSSDSFTFEAGACPDASAKPTASIRSSPSLVRTWTQASWSP